MAHLTQRKNGKWQAKIRRQGWPDQSKVFQTKEAAQQWARAIEREMDIGAFVNRNDAERTTFNKVAERYKTEVLPAKRGRVKYEYTVDRLVETFGPYSLASINAAMISRHRDERLRAVGPQSVVHEIGMLNRIFKACTMDWGIALPQGIPTALVRKPALPGGRTRRLELGEWELLRAALAACKSPVPLAAVEFALATAARQSEVCSLDWKDVNLRDRTARLRGIDGGVTKNGEAFRDVPLSSAAVAVLQTLPRAIKGRVFSISQNALKMSWERAVVRARQTHLHTRLVEELRSTHGLSEKAALAEVRALVYHKREPSALSVELLADLAEVDKTLDDLHFHDLRHEATSRLAEKLQMHELMKVTGHKSSALVARYYHPRASDLAKKLG